MQKPDMVHDRPSYELPYDVPKFNNLVGCVLKVIGVSFMIFKIAKSISTSSGDYQTGPKKDSGHLHKWVNLTPALCLTKIS